MNSLAAPREQTLTKPRLEYHPPKLEHHGSYKTIIGLPMSVPITQGVIGTDWESQ